MTDATPLSTEHAEMLATNWWTGDEFRERGKQRCARALALLIQGLGVPFREGPFSAEETERVRGAIRQYQTASGLEQEDVEDLVWGAIKHEGFWGTISALFPSFLPARTVS
jgi:hypothetical protein